MHPLVRRQSGQSTAELAMLLPVITITALMVVQIGLVARDYVLINHAVREAARQTALDPTEVAALDAAIVALPGLNPDRIDVALIGGRATGDVVTVELRYSASTTVPLVGRFLGDVAMTGRASVRVE